MCNEYLSIHFIQCIIYSWPTIFGVWEKSQWKGRIFDGKLPASSILRTSYHFWQNETRNKVKQNLKLSEYYCTPWFCIFYITILYSRNLFFELISDLQSDFLTNKPFRRYCERIKNRIKNWCEIVNHRFLIQFSFVK